jgi:hypothetical protein
MEFTTLVINAVHYIYNVDLRQKVRSAAFDLIMKYLYCSRRVFSLTWLLIIICLILLK